jgi:hypothetical protein
MTTPEFEAKTLVKIAQNTFPTRSTIYSPFNGLKGKIDADKNGEMAMGKSGNTVRVSTAIGSVYVPFDKIIVPNMVTDSFGNQYYF